MPQLQLRRVGREHQVANFDEILFWAKCNDALVNRSFDEARHLNMSQAEFYRLLIVRLVAEVMAARKALVDMANLVPPPIFTNPKP